MLAKYDELPVDRAQVVDAFADYLRRRDQSPETIRNRVSYACRLMLEHDPVSVSAFAVEEWVYSQGWKPESLNVAITALRKLFGWMQASGRREDNPAIELSTVSVNRKRPRIADDERIQEAVGRSDLKTQIAILLAAECGLRRAEISRVHRSDIQDEWLTVKGKGGRERVVFLPQHLRDRIARVPGKGWLFPSRNPVPQGTHGTYATFQAGCKDEAKCPGHPDSGISCRQAQREYERRRRLGIKSLPIEHSHHVTPTTIYHWIRAALGANTHSLRHRAATAVYHGTGNDLRVTQEFLGHSNPQMTARYVHVTDRDLRLAAIAAQLDLAG